MEKDQECLIYKSIMEEAEMGIVVLDANSMEILYANPVAIGYGMAEHNNYAGLKCYEYLAGEEKPCKSCVLEHVLTQGLGERVKVIQKTGRSYYSLFKVMSWGARKVVTVYITDTTGTLQGEQERQHSERLLGQVIEDANLLYWEYDFEHEMLKNENQVLLNAGYVENPYDICETQIADGFIAEESQDQYRKMFQEMRNGATRVCEEIWFNRNRDNKDKRCIRISYTVECNLEGHPVSASGLGMDITETKNGEILHQKQIDALIRTYPDALGAFKMDLTEDTVMEQRTLYNFIPTQGEQLRIADYLRGMGTWLNTKDHKKYMQIFSRENLMELYQNGQQQAELVHQFRFTDKTRWIRTTVRILPNPLNGHLESYVFAVDISERILSKQIMNKLISLRYDLLALIYPKDGIVDFRYSGNEYENIPEISIEEYDRNRITAAKIYGEDQENEYIECTDLKKIQGELDTKGKYSFTLHRYLNDEKHYKRFSYNYLTDNHDVILVTIQDTTSLFEKEEAQLKTIQAALNEAERANASKTAFLSNMSHDIRTPMNAIINMAKMAEEDINEPEKALEDLRKISVSSDFLLSLINDVLDMAKIDSGKMELHPEVYEYQDFINYIESIFTPLCKNKDIQFICNYGGEGYPLYLDVLKFNQVFFNLISNAVKYTSSGGTVVYELQSSKKKDGYISCDFVVKDTGQGMSKEFQKKMFEPFEREANRGEKHMGTGLGLAIVKSTVDLMGGTINVESELGKGTTFRIHLSLPLATEEQIVARDKKYQITQTISLAGKHILVAEDHPINREIIRRLLEREEIEVDISENGKECVEQFIASKQDYYDAIVMDVRMPVMDGYEATKQIRALDRPDVRTMPIIAMTANAFSEDREQAKEIGMSAYLAKPVNADELYQTLMQQIAAEESRR